MIISATFLKPRERRIREEGYKEGFEEGLAEIRAERAQAAAEAATQAAQAAQREADHATRLLEQERAAWRAWYERSELARAKGEETPPPPFLCTCDCHSD